MIFSNIEYIYLQLIVLYDKIIIYVKTFKKLLSFIVLIKYNQNEYVNKINNFFLVIENIF